MQQSANGILNRAIRVAKLDLPVFREIAQDSKATAEAAIVVAVVAIASGIGALTDSFGLVVVAIVGAFLGWIVFSAMTYFFGKNIFGTPTTQVDIESLMRTQGMREFRAFSRSSASFRCLAGLWRSSAASGRW